MYFKDRRLDIIFFLPMVHLDFLLCSRILDEKINWGRIATLILVAVCVILKVRATGEFGFLAFFRDFIYKAALFINKLLGKWITKQGGWVSSCFYNLSNYLPNLIFQTAFEH